MTSSKIQNSASLPTAEPVYTESYNSAATAPPTPATASATPTVVQPTKTYVNTTTTTTTTYPRVENPRYVDVGTRRPATLNYCPRCGKEHVVTQTRTKTTGATWLSCLVGFFIFWPLCWIPFVCKPMKQTNHYCPSCRAKIGRVKAFQ